MADQTLAQLVRAKYPGSYTNLSDQDLEAAVLKKYPGTYDKVPRTAAAPVDQQPSALTRGATQFYEKSPLAAGVATVKGAANVAAHPLDTFFGLKPLAGTVVDLAKAQWDQAVQAAQKAKEAAGGGGMLSASEAVGHGLAAVLPVLGPAAANVGEHGAQGDVAGMVGGTLGLLAPFAAKYGLEVKKTGSAIPTKTTLAAASVEQADRLTRAAKEQVSQRVLAPGNPKYKGQAAAISPDVLARGMKGDRVALQQLADEGMEKSGAAIDAAAQARTAPMPLHSIVQSLSDRIDEFHHGGEPIPTAAGRVQALTGLRDYLQRLSDKTNGAIPFEQLKSIRDEFYDTADKAKGYMQTGGNEHIADMGWAAREAGGVIRQSIAKEIPELVGPHAEFTFFKRLSDVLDPNIGRPKQTNYVPSGITGGAMTAGAIVGENMLGYLPGGAALGAWLVPKLKAVTNSPAWDLASAQKKMALARALQQGNVGGVRALLNSFSRYAPRGGTSLAVAPASASQPDNRP